MEGHTARASRGRRAPAVTILFAALFLAACSADVAAPTSPSTQTLAPQPTPTAPAETPVEPTDDLESLEPSLDPGETPLESGIPGSADSCAGTDANREFYVTVADKVTWDVYCAVLPKGWSVETGSYRTSGGGWLKIAYKASGGRRFELREGAFCTDPATCVPTGTELASGPFGDREAKVVQVEDGGFGMVVDSGQKLMWAAIGKGMDEATFRAYAQALILVGEY